MKFHKYRHKFADGYGDWITEEGPVPEDLYHLTKEYDWANHYRGVDVEECVPDLEWLINKKNLLEGRRYRVEVRLQRYYELIEDLTSQ